MFILMSYLIQSVYYTDDFIKHVLITHHAKYLSLILVARTDNPG